MWIMTTVGFFSIVEKPDTAPRLTIRARIRQDLIALKKRYLPNLGRIKESDDTDYRFRATATRADVAKALSQIAKDIDYSNFKDEVSLVQGPQRVFVYHKVWAALLDLQPLGRRKPRYSAFTEDLCAVAPNDDGLELF